MVLGHNVRGGGASTESTLEVAEDGSLTLPAGLLKRLKLLPGDEVRVTETDGAIALVPSPLSVAELAERIDQARRAAGLDIDELLASLREARTRYVAEKYGIGTE